MEDILIDKDNENGAVVISEVKGIPHVFKISGVDTDNYYCIRKIAIDDLIEALKKAKEVLGL